MKASIRYSVITIRQREKSVHGKRVKEYDGEGGKRIQSILE